MRGASLRPISASGATFLALCLGLAACGTSSAPSGPVGEGSKASAEATSDRSATQASRTQSASSQANEKAKRSTGARAFIHPGVDNSIPKYGSAGSDPQKAAATRTLAGYLAARESQAWARACSFMGATVRRQLRVLAVASGARPGGCVASQRVLSKYGSAPERASVLSGPLAAFRVKGSRGFALFYGPHHQQFMMPMVREGGRWKVSQSIPIAYPIGAPPRNG